MSPLIQFSKSSSEFDPLAMSLIRSSELYGHEKFTLAPFLRCDMVHGVSPIQFGWGVIVANCSVFPTPLVPWFLFFRFRGPLVIPSGPGQSDRSSGV